MGIMMNNSWRSRVSALIIGGMVLAGCTTQAERIGADDGSDACRSHKVALDSTGNFFAEDMVKGAAVGAIGGALAGALIGGDLKSAAIGAAAGAALGAAGGYWQHLQQQEKDQAVLTRTVLSDLERENAQIDKSQLAFNQLIGCRKNEAKRIKNDLRANRISRAVAEDRMDSLRQQFESDLKLARMIDENIEKRSENFLFANEQLNPGTSDAVQEVGQQRAMVSAPKTGGSSTKPRASQSGSRPQSVIKQAAKQPRVAEQTASNIAKRTSYHNSVEVASTDANQGFILS
ncbi:Gly-zipper_YMGG domain-containing protein [Azospirillaceae bacterium]